MGDGADLVYLFYRAGSVQAVDSIEGDGDRLTDFDFGGIDFIQRDGSDLLLSDDGGDDGASAGLAVDIDRNASDDAAIRSFNEVVIISLLGLINGQLGALDIEMIGTCL